MALKIIGTGNSGVPLVLAELAGAITTDPEPGETP